MRRYETITIMDPDLSEDGRAPVLERIQDVITKEGGTLVEIDHWGNRKLAYEVRKKKPGATTPASTIAATVPWWMKWSGFSRSMTG